MIAIQVDTSGIARMGNLMRAAGKQAPLAMVRAINHTGDKAKTQMRKVLVKQTGLKYGTMVRAIKSKKAFGGGAYEIRSRGGDVRLMFFGARETRRGVSAAPWGTRRVYAGTFTKGGRFPSRVGLNMGGAVLQRVGRGRTPLRTVKSGLFIPEEMVKGDSEAAFYQVVERDLPARLAHELFRVL